MGLETLIGQEDSSHRPPSPKRKRQRKSDNPETHVDDIVSQFEVLEAPQRPFDIIFAEDHRGRTCIGCGRPLLNLKDVRGKQIHVRAFVLKRPYKKTSTSETVHKPANAYFHLAMNCLKHTTTYGLPKFQYELCSVDQKTAAKLNEPQFAKAKDRLVALNIHFPSA